MNDNFLEAITEELLSDRLGKELQKDEQYRAAIAEEERLFNLLNSSLNKEQQKTLKEYFDAASATESNIERLAYKHGMKDLLSLFRSLSADNEDIAK